MMKKLTDMAGGKLTITLAFLRLPGSSVPQPLTLIFYDGPEEAAKELLAPVYELGPIADMAQMREYHTITDPNPLVDGPPSHQNYAASNITLWSEDDGDILEELVKDFCAFMEKFGDAVSPSKLIAEIRSHAVTSSVPIASMAFAGRRPRIFSAIEGQHDSSVSNALIHQEVKAMSDKANASIRKKYPTTSLVFNANIGSGKEKLIEMFGENLPRMREVKQKYDPNFVFNKWFAVAPVS